MTTLDEVAGAMTITMDSQLEAAVNELARRQGVAPEAAVLNVLRSQILQRHQVFAPQDEWERRLLGLAKDCGVSLSDAAVSSEGLYE